MQRRRLSDLQQCVELGIEVGVLQPVPGDQGEDTIEGQHAYEASLVQAAGQEV